MKNTLSQNKLEKLGRCPLKDKLHKQGDNHDHTCVLWREQPQGNQVNKYLKAADALMRAYSELERYAVPEGLSFEILSARRRDIADIISNEISSGEVITE